MSGHRVWRKTCWLCLVLSTLGCGPPGDETREPEIPVAVSREQALAGARAKIGDRCWANARWSVAWWAKKHAWSVTCEMEDETAQASCHARVDADSGAVTPDRLCISTNQDL